ncbi:MAG: NAD(P)H-quinone oxidoreductase subunit I, chloroplastic [Syntrophus sp. SKADARSKE-3]|nr:NAD(P)H-quinone oxidoreductase subunit I, chloroplastic [Syntrophus sp. SKADARSKE-3]
MEIYEQLREILDSHPSTAPKATSIDEILRLLFTPGEAAVAVNMSFKPKSAAKVAEAAGISENDAKSALESMARKGIIFSKNKDGKITYGLVPLIPGLFEFPFMKGGGTPLHNRLAQLWEEYHHEALGASFAGNPTPMMRVIAVEKSITAQNTIHTYEEVRTLINGSTSVALAQCACRVSVAKCDKPKEVCLIFDGVGEFLVERGFARPISKEEGIAVLDQAEAAGLVHTSNNSADGASVICNCCPCCCTILRGKTQLKHPHAFETSRFEAHLNMADCTVCGICAEERCPVKAIVIENDNVFINAGECIGCGLCVTACPTAAIELRERAQIPATPATVQDMAVKVLQEKGRLDAFMKIMMR